MSDDLRAKRVLFVDHTAKMGGGEVALLNLVQNLDRTRYEPVVVLFSDGPLRERLASGDTEVHVLPLSGRVLQTRKDSLGAATLLRFGEVAATLRHILRLARFIRNQRVDIVHTNSLKADVIGGIAARLARKPLIWHIRDRIDRDYLPGPVVRLFRWLCRIIPHRVIANSAATLLTLQLNRENGSEAIYSGINLAPAMRVVHDGLHSAPGGNGGKTSERRVALVGRISPWKGQHIFLKAAALLHQRFPDVRFQIIGGALFQEQQYEQELTNLCHSLGLDACVEFTGFREDVAELIDQLEIVVHASTSGEPFGQVVIEGMAAAKPVVATEGGGIPEIVIDGVTGLLVPMAQAEPMAHAICHLLDNPELARGMGLRGRDRVLEYFTITHTARKVERLYAELLRDQWIGGPSGVKGRAEPFAGLPRLATGPLGKCAIASLSVGLGTVVTIKLRAILGEHAPVSAPYLAVVAICAALLGRWAGFFAAALSAAAIAYLVFPPAHTFRVEPIDQPAFWTFCFVALLLSQVIGMLKASHHREELARRRAEEARHDLNFIVKCGAAFSMPTRVQELLATISYMATSVLCDDCSIELAEGNAEPAKPGCLSEDDVGESTGTGRCLMLPLISRGWAFGSVTLSRRARRPEFQVRDRKLANEFAWRAAMALAALGEASQSPFVSKSH